MALSGSNTTEVLIFCEMGTPQKILYISGNGNPEKVLVFREM